MPKFTQIVDPCNQWHDTPFEWYLRHLTLVTGVGRSPCATGSRRLSHMAQNIHHMGQTLVPSLTKMAAFWMDVHGPHSSPHCSYRQIIGFGPLPLDENCNFLSTNVAFNVNPPLWWSKSSAVPNITRGDRRKFRSQTSDNMDKWKAEVGRVREEKRREEKRREEKRREEERRKKKEDQKEKVSEERRSRCAKRLKSRETLCFFERFVAPEGRKVGSLKRRVRSQLARWEMKKCTPLWREAHLHVKKLITPHVRSSFWSWDVEKVHAVVARSTFPNPNVQKTPAPDHFWKLRRRKSALRCGAKHISKSKCRKHTSFGPLLEAFFFLCTPLWREAHFEVKMIKTLGVRTTFGRSDVVSRGRRKGLRTLPKVSKTWGLCSISKNDGRRGTFEEDMQRCIFRGRRNTRDMFITAVRRSGRWFPERGCILANQIFRFAEMILHDSRSTSYDLASLFRGRRNSLDRWRGKIAKTNWHEAVSSALNFPFLKDVSQNFWCCQVPKLRKSRRIASFLTLSSAKI